MPCHEGARLAFPPAGSEAACCEKFTPSPGVPAEDFPRGGQKPPQRGPPQGRGLQMSHVWIHHQEAGVLRPSGHAGPLQGPRAQKEDLAKASSLARDLQHCCLGHGGNRRVLGLAGTCDLALRATKCWLVDRPGDRVAADQRWIACQHKCRDRSHTKASPMAAARESRSDTCALPGSCPGLKVPWPGASMVDTCPSLELGAGKPMAR